MSSAARKLLQDALHLPPRSRLALAADLLESVEVPGKPVPRAEWDPAWSRELDARWAEAERTGKSGSKARRGRRQE